MESKLPPETPQKSSGSPSLVMSMSESMVGWAMIPTRKPAAARTLPIRALPINGLSM